MKGITIKSTIGLGDAIQFTSVPENYFRATGERLVDVDCHWAFEFNPFVLRSPGLTRQQILQKYDMKPTDIKEMWNYSEPQPRPPNRHYVYTSMAERHAWRFEVPVVMKYPRLYRFEDYPYSEREMIILHTQGKSHGEMPAHVLEHVLRKYRGERLIHIGLATDPDLGIPRMCTPTLWDLASLISKARMFIGVDSGPSWVAACYPDVQLKKVRIKPDAKRFKDWVPLQIENIHSHWDERFGTIHNITEDDIGFTSSYRRI